MAFYKSIATVLLCRKLPKIFEALSKIYDENKYEDLFSTLMNTNETCEIIWKIFFKIIPWIVLINASVAPIISVIWCFISNGHFISDAVYHPFRIVLPWNQSTLHGYAMEMAFEVSCGLSFIITYGSLPLLFISLCLHHRTFYKMFRFEANKLNDRKEHRDDAKHLRKLIDFHISVKDWFLESATVYSPILMVVLIASMLILACAVFQLDLVLRHPDLSLVLFTSVIMFFLAILFIYCYFGKIATESYEKMSDCLCECNWYELLPKLQKHMIIMIANTQRPVYYHGFSVAVMNLETFTDFIQAVFSYYMIFKTLTSK